VTLPPRQATLDAAVPAPVPPPTNRSSRLIAHVELKNASIAKELEAKIPPRLADEKNRPIGVAGHLNYVVDRGPFTVAVEGDTLVVRTDIHGHAEACRGAQCYASCDPQGRATATVPLRLTPDYRFAPSKVVFTFTRGCEVKVLGGMVRIDATPTIQGQLQPALRRVEQEIDAKLPPLRPQAERLWAEMNKARNMPMGTGCVQVHPRGIVQGPVAGTPEAMKVRFGLIAYPEIRTGAACDAAALAGVKQPLPPLAQDPTLPAEDDLVVALVGPLQTTLATVEASPPFDAGNARTRIAKSVAIPVRGPLAQLDLSLKGEACGDVAIRSPITWNDDARSLRLSLPYLMPGERERIGAALNPEILTQSLSRLRIQPALAPDALVEVVPSLAASMSDATVESSAKVTDLKPLDAALRGEDLVASILLRGTIELKQR
jgi:hypothetical protein